ncbi:type II toxin-antitoxin system PemK/MazF family toxin [Streptomyces sp. NPDC020490]|uniref:type II toxin-antitoxin system PemK/MazF family toxin n=1 Tax=Streptomyces sp. NPDC020490 TaxID=3365078 RepID=UPI003799DBDC
MDTSWWPALAAVVLLALVATLVDGWGRGRRPAGRRPAGRRTRPPGRPGARPRVRPRPAEIWWANVPFEDGPGAGRAARGAAGGAKGRDGRAKDRPCLVLVVHGERATVAKITSRYRDERPGVIALPPGAVGDARRRASFLETAELREVPVGDFRRRVGVVDPVLWDQVRHLAG